MRHPTKSLVHGRPGDHRAVGALLRPPGRRRGRGRPDHPAPRRADRRTDHRQRPGAGRRRAAGRAPARRGVAGERGRALHPPAGPASGAAGPELHRPRALPDRRGRHVPLPDDQARAVPLAQPPQRLAAGAHPLLAVRHRVHPASDHADVLPGRPALPARPDLPVDHRPGRAGPARRDLRPRADPARVRHRVPLGHRADRRPPHLDGDRRDHAGTDHRPVLPRRAALSGRRRPGPAGQPRRDPAARPRLRRGRRAGAGRHAGDRPGRSGRQAGTRGRLAAPRRLDLHRLGPGRDRRRSGTTRSPP